MLATHKGIGRRVRDEWTGENGREIGRFSVLGYIFSFVVSSDARLRAYVFFFLVQTVSNSLMWTPCSYL